jgi:hypothetical protein
MLDTGPCKQFFKDASPEEAQSMYSWILGAMEVRGLIAIAGQTPTRKRRSDAGQQRNGAQPTIEAVRERISQPSLSGLPDEDQNGK